MKKTFGNLLNVPASLQKGNSGGSYGAAIQLSPMNLSALSNEEIVKATLPPGAFLDGSKSLVINRKVQPSSEMLQKMLEKNLEKYSINKKSTLI
jgi:hypothetical protein